MHFLGSQVPKFFGVQVGALFSHFGCASSLMDAELGEQVVK